jgi:arsenate reductase
MEKIAILFLCTGNSCRSQMAEGWLKHLRSDQVVVKSAGTEKHGLNPLAVKVMEEAGIDISNNVSKLTSELNMDFDYVITVCDRANGNCPFFPAKTKVIHRGFDDPPRLAKDSKTEDDALVHYRKVRDEIRDYVKTIPQILN